MLKKVKWFVLGHTASKRCHQDQIQLCLKSKPLLWFCEEERERKNEKKAEDGALRDISMFGAGWKSGARRRRLRNSCWSLLSIRKVNELWEKTVGLFGIPEKSFSAVVETVVKIWGEKKKDLRSCWMWGGSRQRMNWWMDGWVSGWVLRHGRWNLFLYLFF